jgi:hypothetical protein
LPRLFDTIPSTIPGGRAYLTPDPRRRAVWRDRLPAPGFRVGLVWAGNPENTADWRRSVPLSMFDPLRTIEGLNLVSLQLQAQETDLGLLDLSAELTDFGETAAIIANLDLVVAVDSAVAHLSAALGVPTWILVYQPADWRWLLVREDSPWYPTVRLFRQPRAGDWSEPVTRLIAALAAMS